MIRLYRIDLPASPAKRDYGFTLVELLVAMAVAALVLVLLVNVITRSLQISQHSAESIAAYSTAAAAIDLIATDLGSIAPVRELAPAGSSTRRLVYSIQALPDPAFPNAAYPNLFAGTNQPMCLLFNVLSTQDSAQASGTGSGLSYPDSGQLRAVCYRLAWQNPLVGSTSAAGLPPAPNPADSIFGLYRQTVSAADTFKYVLGHADAQNFSTSLYSALFANTSWTTGSGPALPPAASEFTAGNVVDLQVAFYANALPPGGTGPLTQPPVIINANAASQSSIPYHNTLISGTTTAIGPDTDPKSAGTLLVGYGPAVYGEVSITVLEDSGAKLWRDGSGSGTTSPQALKQKYGHTLTRKVTLPTSN